ncbi:hypothetical protein TWF694_005452 [Orbilia ellipsospora]|uniref:Nucleoside phosphorylase domain-containing protein n=1 Tax=Orbilia ellipsospora TaxID=2528407 RepID=A0AAV9WT49_9PEZI
MATLFPGLREYTIGWLCALPIELAAAQLVLDETHGNLPFDPNDDTHYTLGRIGNHNIVIGCLSAGNLGIGSAATIAAKMRAKFYNIRVGLMVGIGGGVPSHGDIRLGDVVVSQPTAGHGGVIQYDFGKSVPDGFVYTGFLNAPPRSLLQALANLQARHFRGDKRLMEYLRLIETNANFRRPSCKSDVLFHPTYDHVEGEKTCEKCDKSKISDRKPRRTNDIVIHYGTIASGNRIIKNARERDRLSLKFNGVLCFEMEAAGLMDNFPCLVVRGICDYADSHKHKNWQPYAAAVAAAYAKEFLLVVPVGEVNAPAVEAPTVAEQASNSFEALKSAIDNINLGVFLSLLLVSEQEICDFGLPIPQPEYDWILKNLDYNKWNSADSSQVLWISGPPECDLRQFSLYKVGHDKAVEGNRLVLHFSCFSEITDEGATAVHTLLSQMIHQFPLDRQISIVRCFLNSLLDQAFEENLVRRKRPKLEHLDAKARYILDAPVGHLWIALGAVLTCEANQPLSIVLDGLDHVSSHRVTFWRGVRSFVENIQERTLKVRILLTSHPLTEIKVIFAEFPCIEHDKERKECLDNLRFDNTRYGKISPECEGSFQWIWAHEEYIKWSTSETSQLLYIHGKPGSGKSTLTKYFSHQLLEKEPAINSAIIAKFFYSDREGELQRSHYSMLRSILYDILQQDGNFFYHGFQLEFRNQRARKRHSDWEYESLKRALESLKDYTLAKRVYLILDAIDESDDDDRRNIIKLLLGLCAESKGCLKVFLASRPIGQLEIHRSSFCNSIKLQDQTKSDIRRFASSLLYDINFTHFLSEATEYIVKNAQGVFIWVKLVGEELLLYHEEGYFEEAVFVFLKRLPTELEDFYRRMLERMQGPTNNFLSSLPSPTVNSKSGLEMRPIARHDLPDRLTMFKFVLFARRPLKAIEILHALGISDSLPDSMALTFTPSDDTFEKRIPSPQRIISCGGHFLEIRSSGINNALTHQTVQFMHQTAREFFLRIDKYAENSDFRIVEQDAHISISTTCIRYLLLCATKIASIYPDISLWTPQQFDSYAQYLDERPLAHYALRYLKDHMDGCRRHPNFSSLHSEFITTLSCKNVANFLGWWSHLLFPNDFPSEEERAEAKNFKTAVLCAAVDKGFAQAVEILQSIGADIKVEDISGRTLLWHAAARGHGPIVKLLLTTNAELNKKDKDGRTPLSMAAQGGHERAVRTILAMKGIEAEDVNGRTKGPLSWAAENGHEEVVKLILGYTKEINWNDDKGKTPLSMAAEKGYDGVVTILLAMDNIRVDSMDWWKRTPLWRAAESGHGAVVKLLLTANAEVNREDRDGRTPVSIAAANGHKGVVEILLTSTRLVLDAGSRHGRTPLWWAARAGHEAIVKLLAMNKLKEGEWCRRVWGAPLRVAVRKGHEKVVREMLDIGSVDADALDHFGKTVLFYAVEEGHEMVVKTLLNVGNVEPDRKDKSGRTPLSYAEEAGHKSIVRLLLATNRVETGVGDSGGSLSLLSAAVEGEMS